MASWTKDFLVEFIDMFRAQEILWKVKCKDYHNKSKRNECYDILVKKVKGIDSTANRDLIAKKINNLRSTFRKEHKKVVESKSSGTGADDVYIPKLWYYDNLLFLVDQETPSESTSSIVESDTEDTQSSSTFPQELHSPPTPAESRPDSRSDVAPSTSRDSIFTPKCKKQKKTVSASDQVLGIVGEHLSSMHRDDEHAIFGKNVAAKLRKLPKQQRLHAEKIINDALYEAAFDNLGRGCGLYTGFKENSSTSVSTQNEHLTQPSNHYSPDVSSQTFQPSQHSKENVNSNVSQYYSSFQY